MPLLMWQPLLQSDSLVIQSINAIRHIIVYFCDLKKNRTPIIDFDSILLLADEMLLYYLADQYHFLSGRYSLLGYRWGLSISISIFFLSSKHEFRDMWIWKDDCWRFLTLCGYFWMWLFVPRIFPFLYSFLYLIFNTLNTQHLHQLCIYCDDCFCKCCNEEHCGTQSTPSAALPLSDMSQHHTWVVFFLLS